VMLLRSAKHALDASDDDLVDWWASQNKQATTKKCPDCAETVLADARVCKHCGYRFAPAASSAPATKPPAPKQPANPPKPAPSPHSSKPPEVQQNPKPPVSSSQPDA
jgi:hypothetical protein